ncbi:MAG: ABC transporter substrate-binding protein [Bauldia sp.]|nr:ABC transporter substrate-binding protein [Bauldia sp.]
MFFLVIAAAWVAGSGAAAAAPPSRIASINLCADELLIALADPDQIASLSVYATDPKLSYFAREAAAYPHGAGEAETVVELEPDLVLAGRYTKRATRDMLTQLGYPLELLDAARSIDDSIAQIRQVAAIVGHPERGEALIEEIEAARRRATEMPAGKPVTGAVYQRRGYVTGGDTLTGELMTLVGIANAGGDLAGARGGFVRLEELVATPPDLILVTTPSTSPGDQGEALLAHPALAALYPPEKRILLPERLTVCGGPSLPAAIDWLASEARRVADGR